MTTEPMRTSTSAGRPVLLLLVLTGLLAAYAIYLNRVYYARQGPFYDSMSYMMQLAKVMGTVRTQNLSAALRVGIEGQTVFFPWLEGALLALVVNPAREQAVLIQLPLVVAQVLASYFFFRRVARYPSSVSVCFAMVTIGFLAMFKVDGGLSDLRLDLSQALAFGAAVAFLALARVTQNIWHWLVFGLVLGVAFLFRATTPVYAVLLFGMAGTIDLVLSRTGRKEQLLRYLAAAAVALLVSLWFYIVNYGYLHFYYFVWNFDANARLARRQSIKHLDYLFNGHLGKPLCVLMVVVLLTELFMRWRRGGSLWRGLNWVPLLAGLVPIAFLVLFGAALNPYVSMVSVPGFLLFALAPYAADREVAWSRQKTLAYVLGGTIAVVTSMPQGIDTHSRAVAPYVPTMDGLRELTGAIHKDVQRRRKPAVKFEVSYAGGLDMVSVLNSLIFDQGYTYDITNVASRDGLAVRQTDSRGPGVLTNIVQWHALAGATDAEKVNTLATTALKQADYLIVPEDGTTLLKMPSTPYVFSYRDQLISRPGVTRIAGPIRISPTETVSLYWNEHAN